MNLKLKSNLFAVFLLATTVSSAQSTSNWIKVSSNDSSSSPIVKNASYVTLKVLNAKIYHKSNWWSQLVGKNKKAFFTIDVAALYPNGKKVENRWSSDLVAIERKQKPIEIGWSKTVVNELPSTFSSLKVDVTLGYNSVDGMDKVIGIVSDLSKNVPALSPVQSAMGIVSGTKGLLDELFNKKLAESYLRSNNDLIPASKSSLATGYYVVFGEQTAAAYQKYKDGANSLFWNGHDLLFKDSSINDVNYFVIGVESIDNRFVTKDLNILSDTDPEWVKFYIQANKLIDSWSKLGEEEKLWNEVRENLAAAKAVLDLDPVFVFKEKEEIHSSLKNIFTAKIVSRKAALAAGTTLSPP